MRNDLPAFRGLTRRIKNIIFGYKKRGKDVNRRTKRIISKR
jgi:hypothetical protein